MAYFSYGIYPFLPFKGTTPKPAKNGIFQESKVDALNTASFYDKEILELIVRTGEDAYLNGKKTEAKDIFNSVLDATEGSNQEMVDCELIAHLYEVIYQIYQNH